MHSGASARVIVAARALVLFVYFFLWRCWPFFGCGIPAVVDLAMLSIGADRRRGCGCRRVVLRHFLGGTRMVAFLPAHTLVHVWLSARHRLRGVAMPAAIILTTSCWCTGTGSTLQHAVFRP